MISIRVSGFIVLALAGCQRAEPVVVTGAEDVCAYRMSGGVCHVSPTQLLTSPEKMAGRDVIVVLYYPGFEARVLFASRDAAQSNDLSSGFVVPGDDRASGEGAQSTLDQPGYYRVLAHFERSKPVIVGEGGAPSVVVAGRFERNVEARRISSLDEVVEECSALGNCSMGYSQGLLPMPRLDSIKRKQSAVPDSVSMRCRYGSPLDVVRL